jgi:hypothetical protein
LGNLPAGAVIDAANCPHPNGYAVLNPACEYKGSASYTTLGIDPNIYSPTGIRYTGGQLVTPGILYALTSFKSTPKSDPIYKQRQVQSSVYSNDGWLNGGSK